MITISWNYRGLGAKIKCNQLNKLSFSHNPNFLFIQETKLEQLSQKIIKSLWVDDDVVRCPSVGNLGGIISLWKTSTFKVKSYHIYNNWIATCGVFLPSNFSWSLINIYDPCDAQKRSIVWKDVTEYWHGTNLPTMIMGDFNEGLSSFDSGSRLGSQFGIWLIPKLHTRYSFDGDPTSNGFYTWFRGNLKSKLDHCLINPEFVFISDHCPLLVSSMGINWGPKPFRFLNCWISHPNCLRNIQKACSVASHLFLLDKLKFLRGELKAWNETEFRLINQNLVVLRTKFMSWLLSPTTEP